MADTATDAYSSFTVTDLESTRGFYRANGPWFLDPSGTTLAVCERDVRPAETA